MSSAVYSYGNREFFMTENQQNEKEINYEVNLLFIDKVRKDVVIDPKT